MSSFTSQFRLLSLSAPDRYQSENKEQSFLHRTILHQKCSRNVLA
jgi:hypothetical protein